ncbi:heavy metal translocating P-type ATPase [Beutenbergia cavernae DSM 12333]|uniref:Heavy metal translocating P-type ATPase n=1 Tax=Beutenbergia cavernae (strain ATCC BAA-8 / DSM 12333 / CCUG 43141 / JCM 11478 / NBRC 16432 / NCIMB 13614 / HKI 0122) TaxID=471853 RepID=C5BVR5_BEUC1|nr:heavy metal translocating P-type ATPase [Beutenbergia cavernae]ACQ78505.1 heavy metal translocating P-type ATPase [Beutenbergia cavernae DSM 12333]
MRLLVLAARHYPWVVGTLLVAAAAAVMMATPARELVPWLLGGYALVVAARSAWGMVRDLMAGTLGIDLLAVTAICATVAVGEYWAALVVVLMLTGGEALEDYAAHRARRDLTSLLSHAPERGHQIRPDGTTEDVPIADVRPGDRLVVRPHETVPVDATLVSPSGTFDESTLTGESLPVDLTVGQEVLSGAVNGSSAVTIAATRSAADSQFQQIVALVAEAAESKSRVVRLADRFAVPFTAVALGIAGTAWWLSGEAVRFAEVLVVATPCPLIIAAPVAFMAGMSRAAREGVIVKSSATLEVFHRARTVAFDKTGTLTWGRPDLTDVRPSDAFEADDVLRLAASAEQYSAHTLAASVVAGAQRRGLARSPAEHADEVTAGGVRARVDGRDVVVGKRSFVAEAVGSDIAATPLTSGELAVYVAADRTYTGALVLRDEVRPNARATIADLRRQGIRHILMLTGDAEATAQHVAAELAIDDVRAGCLPADKVAAVRAVTPRPVVMVGDGVNDAPVLATADVGIAMGARGSTAASESADVVILRDDISRVARALAVGRETVDVALQSIWFGISLSVALMLVAAFGVLPAIVGAWLQEAVDVVSILWALRAVGSRGTRGVRTAETPRAEPSRV